MCNQTGLPLEMQAQDGWKRCRLEAGCDAGQGLGIEQWMFAGGEDGSGVEGNADAEEPVCGGGCRDPGFGWGGQIIGGEEFEGDVGLTR